MSVKQFLDENPFAALVAVIVTTGTLVAGVMAYLSNAEHKSELLDLSAKHYAELSERTSSLNKTIDDLSSKWTSIEIKLPGSGPDYLDVSKITIGPEEVMSLPKKITNSSWTNLSTLQSRREDRGSFLRQQNSGSRQ